MRQVTHLSHERFARRPSFSLTALAMAMASLGSGSLHAAEASQAPTAASVELDAIYVTGQTVEQSTEHVTGYVAKRNMSVTKTNTPITETPQSLSVVTNDELRDRQAETLAQALAYTPGFTSNSTSFNRTADRFRIRGFEVESATGGSLRDGLRLQNNSYDGIQEPYGLERV